MPMLADFNPRSPCGERLAHPVPISCRIAISIHAPRVGSDRGPPKSVGYRADFNPRSPCGERLFLLRGLGLRYPISIHAPRVGSDCTVLTLRPNRDNFNPRSPCGERLCVNMNMSWLRLKFQSTLPVWGATIFGHFCCRRTLYFNPRSPCGERLP